MTKRSLRNIETRKKKARRALPRPKVTRIQGNTPAVRKRLKKLAGKARAAKAKGTGAAAGN
ncbi:MAG TPA: hypothetical protein VNK52_05255 [Hyphomicrobiaceae bacterium]|nr:hypothetical protein [Hyphomicrobiaceae bacterium]